jgi:hypothetical protein
MIKKFYDTELMPRGGFPVKDDDGKPVEEHPLDFHGIAHGGAKKCTCGYGGTMSADGAYCSYDKPQCHNIPASQEQKASGAGNNGICAKCGEPIGNIVFTVCDNCWQSPAPVAEGENRKCTHDPNTCPVDYCGWPHECSTQPPSKEAGKVYSREEVIDFAEWKDKFLFGEGLSSEFEINGKQYTYSDLLDLYNNKTQ